MNTPRVFQPTENSGSDFICYHTFDTCEVPYRVIVTYDGNFVSCPDGYVVSPDTVKVFIQPGHAATGYKVHVIPEECIKDPKNFVDRFLDELKARHELLKEFEVICNDTNNSEQDRKEGRLNVDLVFYGSLAQHVRDQLDELARYGDEKDQCNRT